MRVIAGKLRGKPLISPIDDEVRPTIDRVKEGLFNVIQFNIADKTVLDLFGGSGSLGIEAYSRGAKEVIIVDNSSKSMKVIKDNIASCKADIQTILSDSNDAIRRFENKKTFDLVFLDPPYDSNLAYKAMEAMNEKNILNNGAIIVFEHDGHVKTEDVSGYRLLKEKEYGRVIVSFYEKIG